VKLYRSIDQLAQVLSASVVAIGNFDGVHLGHQELIRQARALAKQHRAPLVVMTFDPGPRVFFQPQQHVQLQRLSEKYFELQHCDVDMLLSLRFDASLADVSAECFVQDYLVSRLKVKAVVVGEDFRFGAKRAGDQFLLARLAKQSGFDLQLVSSVMLDGERVSSSRVRQALANGDMSLAARLLGRPYSMVSRVVYGDQRGREWGFPTANCPVHRHRSPVNGIFAVRVKGEDFDGFGVASVGFRPVFVVRKPLLEVFILDFDRDIYGQRLQVDFLHKLRDEENFNSVDALIKRIHQDVLEARAFFKEY